MKKPFLIAGIVIVLLALFGIWRWTHPTLTDEEQIQANIAGIELGASHRAAGEVAWYLSEKFNYNGTKRSEFRKQLTLGMLQYRIIDLSSSGVQIKVNGDSATSSGTYQLSLKSEPDSSPEIHRGEFKLSWVREEGTWKLRTAEGDQMPNIAGG